MVINCYYCILFSHGFPLLGFIWQAFFAYMISLHATMSSAMPLAFSVVLLCFAVILYRDNIAFYFIVFVLET